MVEADCPQNIPDQPALLMARTDGVSVCLPTLAVIGSETLGICIDDDTAVVENAGSRVAGFACADPVIRSALLDAGHVRVLARKNDGVGFVSFDCRVRNSVCEMGEMSDDQ